MTGERVLGFLLPLFIALAGRRIVGWMFPEVKTDAYSGGERFALGMATGALVFAQVVLAVALLGGWGLEIVAVGGFGWGAVELLISLKRFAADRARLGAWQNWRTALAWLALLPLVVLFGSLFWLAGLEGLQEFDAVQSWAFKAKVFYLARGEAFFQAIHNPHVRSAHYEYPHLVPSLYTLSYALIGRVNEFILHNWPVWMLLAAIIGVLGLCRWPKRNRVAAPALVTAIAFMPMTLRYVRMEGGTIPILFFVVLGFCQLMVAIEQGNTTRGLIGLFVLFGAAMTKIEGIITLGFSGIALWSCFGTCSLFVRKRSWLVAVICLTLGLPFVAFRAVGPVLHVDTTVPGNALQDVGRVLAVFPETVWLVVVPRFVSHDFAAWSVANKFDLTWTGSWEGLASLVDVQTAGFAWVAVVLTAMTVRTRASSRRPMVAFGLIMSGFLLVYCFLNACYSTLVGLQFNLGKAMGRHLYPYLVAWGSTAAILFMRPEHPEPRSASDTSRETADARE